MTILASRRLQTCRVEDFSFLAAAEATAEMVRGRFVLQRLTFMGAASLGLGGQRDSRGKRGGSGGRGHLRGNAIWGAIRGGSGRRQRLGRGRFGLALLAQAEKHVVVLLVNAAQPGFVAQNQSEGA